jgi:hypothetical protein
MCKVLSSIPSKERKKERGREREQERERKRGEGRGKGKEKRKRKRGREERTNNPIRPQNNRTATSLCQDKVQA